MRYGVIGTGMMGIEHLNNLLHLPGAQITAVSDPTPKSLGWARRALGDQAAEVAAFADHRELLASGLVDAVVVASPNHTHIDVALDAVAAGVHVLVEKPLCTTVADCRRLEAAPRRPGQVVWVGLEYRYMPPIAALLAEVRSGTAGRLHMVAIREHRFPFLPKVGDWNRFNRNTGGTLVEKCCHFFDLMRQITASEPVRVLASGGQDVNHLDERYGGEVPDLLDNAFVIVEFASGARGLLDLCMFAEASVNEQEVSVVGDQGKVEALVPEGVLRVGRRERGLGARAVDVRTVTDERVAYAGFHHGSSFVEHLGFLAAARGEGPVEVPLADGTMSVAMGVAAHRSIDEGRPVELAEVLG